jgi:hypothetical protein
MKPHYAKLLESQSDAKHYNNSNDYEDGVDDKQTTFFDEVMGLLPQDVQDSLKLI